jgi:hypothetical protein
LNSGIENQGTRQQLHLRKESTCGRIFRKTAELEIKKQIVGSLTGLWEVSNGCAKEACFHSNKRTAITKEMIFKRSLLRCYNQDQLAVAVRN